MFSSNQDGDLTQVNPGLLELSRDPKEWREQRRRAMKERIFGHKDSQGGYSGSSDVPNNEHAPLGRIESTTPSLPTSQTPCGPGSDGDRAQQEAFILQQILCRKRQREERGKGSPAVEPTHDAFNKASSAPCELSIKDKLLQKYKTT
ncbi:unnamed protein product [Phytomonas sp. EM1]|nr:unnamed protein product [Phytomonas sp. EM1]|eukprot:CCW59926.1 unnamed protein product [Phytomonas sp. isolate EM1]